MLINLPNAFGDAPTNMAIDAALLENMPEGLAAFRHYGWLEPAVTFGYAQTHAEVRQIIGKDPTLCRRLTGGGIVDHRNDWTYALVLHKSLAAASIPATTLYQRIHQSINQTLEQMGVESHLAPCPKTCASPNHASQSTHHTAQCFVMPAANDVIRSDGRKIAGAAMKRHRNGLLIQGSLDCGALPAAFEFTRFQQILVEAIAATLDLDSGKLEDLRPLFKSELIEEEKKRFHSDAWNQKR